MRVSNQLLKYAQAAKALDEAKSEHFSVESASSNVKYLERMIKNQSVTLEIFCASNSEECSEAVCEEIIKALNEKFGVHVYADNLFQIALDTGFCLANEPKNYVAVVLKNGALDPVVLTSLRLIRDKRPALLTWDAYKSELTLDNLNSSKGVFKEQDESLHFNIDVLQDLLVKQRLNAENLALMNYLRNQSSQMMHEAKSYEKLIQHYKESKMRTPTSAYDNTIKRGFRDKLLGIKNGLQIETQEIEQKPFGSFGRILSTIRSGQAVKRVNVLDVGNDKFGKVNLLTRFHLYFFGTKAENSALATKVFFDQSTLEEYKASIHQQIEQVFSKRNELLKKQYRDALEKVGITGKGGNRSVLIFSGVNTKPFINDTFSLRESEFSGEVQKEKFSFQEAFKHLRQPMMVMFPLLMVLNFLMALMPQPEAASVEVDDGVTTIYTYEWQSHQNDFNSYWRNSNQRSSVIQFAEITDNAAQIGIEHGLWNRHINNNYTLTLQARGTTDYSERINEIFNSRSPEHSRSRDVPPANFSRMNHPGTRIIRIRAQPERSLAQLQNNLETLASNFGTDVVFMDLRKPKLHVVYVSGTADITALQKAIKDAIHSTYTSGGGMGGGYTLLFKWIGLIPNSIRVLILIGIFYLMLRMIRNLRLKTVEEYNNKMEEVEKGLCGKLEAHLRKDLETTIGKWNRELDAHLRTMTDNVMGSIEHGYLAAQQESQSETSELQQKIQARVNRLKARDAKLKSGQNALQNLGNALTR